MTVTPITSRTDARAEGTATPPSRREGTEVRRSRDLVRLLDRHEELRGVYAMADLLDDAVRWTA